MTYTNTIVKNYIQEIIEGEPVIVQETYCLSPIFEIGKATIIVPYIDIEGSSLDIESSEITLLEKENET